MLGPRASTTRRERRHECRHRRGAAVGARPVSVRGSLRDVSFDLHRGEVLGITGLTGSGLTELARAIFGSEDDPSRERRASPSRDATGRAGRSRRIAAPRRGAAHQRPAARGHPARVRRCSRTSACRSSAASSAGFGLLDEAAMLETGRARHRAAAGAGARAERDHQDAQRRQPAEAAVRQVARDAAARSSSWTSRPSASTSARSSRSARIIERDRGGRRRRHPDQRRARRHRAPVRPRAGHVPRRHRRRVRRAPRSSGQAILHASVSGRLAA